METLVFQGLVGLSVSMYLWLLAAGLTIVFGVLGVLNFAHGSLFMLGGYFTFTYYGLWGVNFWLAIVLSLLSVGAFFYGIFTIWTMPTSSC
jgi:branched-chain amino acid transport system permease protein